MEAKFLAGVFSLLSVFVAIYAQSEPDFFQPIYDVPKYKMRILSIGYPLALSCKSINRTDLRYTWEKDGVEISKVESIKPRYHINHIEGILTIHNTNTNDDGDYSCRVNNQKADFHVIGAIDIRVPTNLKLLEGEKLTIPCKVLGTDPQISWVIRTSTQQTISNSTDRYILKADENNIKNAILEVENVRRSDKGEYQCTARNAASEFHLYHSANDVAYVRISQSSRSCALSIYFVLLLSTVLTFSPLRKY